MRGKSVSLKSIRPIRAQNFLDIFRGLLAQYFAHLGFNRVNFFLFASTFIAQERARTLFLKSEGRLEVSLNN